jgi:hypothetical protein
MVIIANGSTIDTSSYTITFSFGYKGVDPTALYSVTATSAGLITVPSSATSSLTPGEYYYDIKCTDADGNIFTPVKGPLYIGWEVK